MILRFNQDLSQQAISAHGSELAQILGHDTDATGTRVHTWPEEIERYVATLSQPVLITDHYRIATQFDPVLRDTLFALFSAPVKVTEFQGTRVRFVQGDYGRVWGPSIDTLLFCRALGNARIPPPQRVLEIGSGSGFISKYALQHIPGIESLTAVDFDPDAVRATADTLRPLTNELHEIPQGYRGDGVTLPAGILVREQDGISTLDGQRYDLVLCNPPYIPRPKSIDDNPYEGIGLLHHLITHASDYLAPNGRLITNVSSLCRPLVADALADPALHVRTLDTMDVPLKVFNVLNNPVWMEYLRARDAFTETRGAGYSYWQTLRITEIALAGAPEPQPASDGTVTVLPRGSG